MKELFDSTIKEFKKDQEQEKDKMKEAFQYVLNESNRKVEGKDLSFFISRVEKIEKLLSQMTIETQLLKEK